MYDKNVFMQLYFSFFCKWSGAIFVRMYDIQQYKDKMKYKTLLHSIYIAYDVEIHQMSTVTRDSKEHLTNFITKVIVS